MVESDVCVQACSFLSNIKLVLSATQVSLASTYKRKNYSQEYPKDGTGLHLGARVGLLAILEHILLGQKEEGAIALYKKDSYGQTPLYLAAENGHYRTTKLLLENGADINAQGGHFGNALQAALCKGHVAIVRLLLEANNIKASVGAQTDSGYASKSRSESLISHVERNGTLDFNKDEESNEHLLGSDIESVDSDLADIRSEASLETTPVENEGKAHLARFLAYDRELGPLCEKVLSRMGRTRLPDTFRKLLKSFYQNLLQDVATERERVSIQLLQSRRGRLRIGKAITNLVDPYDDKDAGEMKSLAEQAQTRAEYLDNWIEKIPRFDPDIKVCQQPENPTAESTVLEIHDYGHDYSSSEDADLEIEHEEAELPHLTEMERFFRNSRSFQTLLNDVRKLLLPRSIKQVIHSIPKDQIWLSTQQNRSLVNQTKAFIEDYTQLEWNWWPLEPRMQCLKDGEARLFWRCFCGACLWEEISLEEAELIKQILPSLSKNPQWPHRCKVKRDVISWMQRLPSIIHSAVPVSSAHQRYTPPGNVASSPTTGQASQSTNIGRLNSNQDQYQQQRAVIAGQQSTVTSVHPATTTQSWVLFGVQGSRRTLEINHIPIHSHSNDSSFYCLLRQYYRASRGRLRLWFSFWRLDYCEVVKFKRIAPKWIIKDCKDLPEQSEYIYDPRPPNAKNPPISRHEFSMHLNACEHPCRWSFFHECMPLLGTSSAIGCIPKRRKIFASMSDNPSDMYAWGLEAKHVISAAYVVIYHLVIFLLPFGFWGWWMKHHPNDLQGASIPVTVVLGLLSLFWSTNGILTQGRQHSEVD